MSDPTAEPARRPGFITVNGGEPQRGLIPTDTVEGYGGRVVDLLFTGLYRYDADGVLVPEVADTVTTEDNRRFLITLRPGWTFTDGTPVTAHSFVDAWNFGALSTNRQAQRTAFAPIAGYPDVAARRPLGSTMSGLTVEDDLAFTVLLRRPRADFAARLALLPFRPLPRAFFARGPEAFAERPIGNGPYRPAGGAPWRNGSRIDLEAVPGYPGSDRARNAGITFVSYPNLSDAFADVRRGNLDVLDIVPADALPGALDELGDRAIVRPVALNKSLAIPQGLPHFGGEEGRLRRRAVSLSIDRERITREVFHGTRRPARDFTAQVLPGFDADLPGSEVLGHDPAAARSLWEEADRIAAWEGVLSIAYNDHSGHEEWVAAVSRQIEASLGIEVTAAGYPTFREIRDRAEAGTLRAAYRKGWRGEFPALLDFLEPVFTRGAASNDFGYASPAFDALLSAAASASDGAEARRLIGEAQSTLLRDLPVIPLWDYLNVSCRGDGVSVRIRWNGLPDYPHITKR